MLARILLFIVGSFMIMGCQEKDSQEIVQMDFETLEPLLNKDNDTVYVVNFWATWCKPCIEELPEFEKLNQDYKSRQVKVILVSLDFPNKYEELLLPYLKNNNIKSDVIHLTEVNANKWIDRVNPEWSGAIPATLIYKGASRQFYERKMSYDELKTSVELKLK